MPEPAASATFTVRVADVGDAGDIARVQVQGWHEAYTGRMPQSILDGMTVERRTAAWRSILTAPGYRTRGTIWVAESDGEVIGMASAGPCHDDDGAADRVELYAIYVLAAHYGSGAGQALLDAALGTALVGPADPAAAETIARGAASLWVLDDNPRARAFYARNGFVPDGAVKLDDRWGEPIREVRLVRAAR